MFQVKVDTSTVEVMDDLEPLTDVGLGICVGKGEGWYVCESD